jgi:hypothetical protein
VVSLFQGKSHFERSVQFRNLAPSQGPHEAGQLHCAEIATVRERDVIDGQWSNDPGD